MCFWKGAVHRTPYIFLFFCDSGGIGYYADRWSMLLWLTSLSLVFHCVGSAVYKYITGNAYGEIDAVATLYCVFPLESSAMSNQKAVLCTASFVISEHCFVQARQCSEKLKPLFRVAFLLRIALVIPAVGESCAFRTKCQRVVSLFLPVLTRHS